MAASGASVSAPLFEDGATARIPGALYRSFLRDGSETPVRPRQICQAREKVEVDEIWPWPNNASDTLLPI